MSNIFYEDNALTRYEQQEQWEESVTYLADLVTHNLLNKHILYRLAAQCWYVLTFWDCNMPKGRLDRTIFESNLELAYTFAQRKWWDDSDCLWLFGYFMSINQMDFSFVSANIFDVEKAGDDLILKSLSLNPENQLAEVLYLANTANKHKYFEEMRKLRGSISVYFPSHSKVDEYFAEILTRVY